MNSQDRSIPQNSLRQITASPLLERLIHDGGLVLLNAVVNASHANEVEAMLPLVVEYNVFTSNYGEATGRMPESLAVDLNEAALLKLDELRRSGTDTEWLVFANQFGSSIESLTP